MNHLDNSKHQQSNVDERLKKKKNGNKKSDEEKVEREKTQDKRWRHVSIDRMSASSSGTKNRWFQKWTQPNFNAKLLVLVKTYQPQNFHLKLIVSPKCNSYWFQ